jgi:cell pole-organizing protein PopZ
MDGIFTNKRDAEPAPHVAGVSVVPPEDTAMDEPFGAGLLSHETSAAVGSAFYTLTQAVRKQNSQTLEDLVREILQTAAGILARQLAQLNRTHLRTEIERIARER